MRMGDQKRRNGRARYILFFLLILAASGRQTTVHDLVICHLGTFFREKFLNEVFSRKAEARVSCFERSTRSQDGFAVLTRDDGMLNATNNRSSSRTRNRKEDQFMPQPNDQCPCGSGKAYKDCCGKSR